MKQDIVKEIKELALKQYDQGGHWVVECYTDEEIAKEFSSVEEAQKAWEEKEEYEQEHQAAREFYNDGNFWADFYGVKTS